MEAYDNSYKGAQYGFREHSRYAKMATRAKTVSISTFSMFVAGIVATILSQKNYEPKLPVALLNVSLITAFVAKQSGDVRRNLEILLSKEHTKHPVILNKAFADIKEELTTATQKFAEGLKDNDKGTLTITEI